MDWDELMCGESTSTIQQIKKKEENRNERHGHALFKRIEKNSFVIVYVKCSKSIKGYFVEAIGDEVFLYNFNQHDRSVITICREAIVAVEVINKNHGNRQKEPTKKTKPSIPLLKI
ncbi:hypothetical protein [Alkalihalobacillus pseudalcaliphilus]|uniref:hypothetical protein n=1 Tax=Alkalihalobacillus pseudalcaliphilus TaxID=79884 RepID=UPI00064E097B|nr:hypothetical protein [Alkalihalobacillus pseudalcaliphilus]KMK74790.1 hypothetical protein AB990_20120 [Alkalihalobacillus pseudalcaliphilus]